MRKIQRVFGDNIYINGSLQRKKLRHIIMYSPGKRKKLNDIMHPEIQMEIWHASKNHNKQHTVIDIPLLTKDNVRFYPYLTYILNIQCPLSVRVPLLMLRDNISYNAAIRTIASQPTDVQREVVQTYSIANVNNKRDLFDKVDFFYKEILT